MLPDITIDIPLVLIISLICAIIFCISLPQRPNHEPKMPQRRSVVKESALLQTDTQISNFLVLDVEGTCVPNNRGFDWPNEIIEWPVILLRWEQGGNDKPKRLVVVDEFHSFCRPTFNTILHPFCTELTGITQAQVDNAPTFPEVLSLCQQFLVRNGILDSRGRALETFIWCTDGPWDLRDFWTKQAFISRINRPTWIPTRILDVREAVGSWYSEVYLRKHSKNPQRNGGFSINTRYKLNKQLDLLGLEFEGREHSGIDDARNIARIVIELAARGMTLRPNLDTSSNRRYEWMGPNGTIIGDYQYLP